MTKSSKGQVVEAIGGKDREGTYATQKEEVFTQSKAEPEIKKLMQKGGNGVDRPIMQYGPSYLGSNEEKMHQIKVERSNSGLGGRTFVIILKEYMGHLIAFLYGIKHTILIFLFSNRMFEKGIS